jgi:CheY-like chemotaxis protein
MKEALNILLVEDDPDDIDLFEYALEDNDVACQLEVIMEGDGVLPYLRGLVQQPDVVVLDLNLPKVPGREVLQLIKSAPQLRSIPVAVLTTSSAQEDADSCYALGADRFLTKPASQDGFTTTIRTIVELANRPKEPAV